MHCPRAIHVLACVAALAAAGLVALAIAERREIEGRYWLFRLAHGTAPGRAIRHGMRALGPADPRLLEALRVDPEDVRLELEEPPPVPPTPSAAVSAAGYYEIALPPARVTNISGRRLVICGEVIATHAESVEQADGTRVEGSLGSLAPPSYVGPEPPEDRVETAVFLEPGATTTIGGAVICVYPTQPTPVAAVVEARAYLYGSRDLITAAMLREPPLQLDGTEEEAENERSRFDAWSTIPRSPQPEVRRDGMRLEVRPSAWSGGGT